MLHLLPLVSLALISPSWASIGPTADVTLVNAVVSPDGFSRSAVTANGIIPGPLIVGNKGDEFNLNVIKHPHRQHHHWHGFFQKNSSWADGPAFVNQCPIAANDTFLYTFSAAEQTGTFWYHSHLSTQYCDGLRGVVYDPADPHASLYESTVITLADWFTLISTLINGLGRYAGGPTSELAVISVTAGVRYRFRLVSLSCDPNFIFTIDGHTFTIIEVDSVNVAPLEVDSIQIYAGQRYSFVLTANQPVDNYWIRTVANGGTAGFDNGINSAILRYVGAAVVDPATTATTAAAPLAETDLHPLVATPVPGTHTVGAVDVALNLAITLDFTTFKFAVNGASYTSPTLPVLLQILSGQHTAAELLPAGSVYTLPPNSVVELSIPGGTPGAPHPFHLHGHNFWVVRSAGSTEYNWDDPVIRDVVSTGAATTDNTTIRFVTDNAGPYYLPLALFRDLIYFTFNSHIDFHLDMYVFSVLHDHLLIVSSPAALPLYAWDTLCPRYDALTPDQLGGQ
ncbi:laccase [Mycena olivaceomarginata]|nr:laccase [Mycena olivaceomarginata]